MATNINDILELPVNGMRDIPKKFGKALMIIFLMMKMKLILPG